MCGDREDKWQQRVACPAGSIRKRVEDCPVPCDHENPFGGSSDYPLRIDSLVETPTAFVEDRSEKGKEFVNKVGVLLLEYFTTKGAKMVSPGD